MSGLFSIPDKKTNKERSIRMEINEFIEAMKNGQLITTVAEARECMHMLSQEALRLTSELKGGYGMRWRLSYPGGNPGAYGKADR